jgi:hypothetical protein
MTDTGIPPAPDEPQVRAEPVYSPTDVPCEPWCAMEDVTGCGPCKNVATGTLDDVILTASAWLWRLTGKQYGICEITVLPLGVGTCWPVCSGYETFNRSTWYFDRAHNCWYGANGRYARDEGYLGVPEVRLGFANVQEVTQVAISGVPLDAASYRVDDGRWLVRTDGLVWPTNDDVTLTPPLFQVTLRHGLPIPPDGVNAAAVLACELALGCAQDNACRLPKRVQTITRQGVSMVLMDPLTILDEGKFGIPEVDYFVKGANPYGNRQRARVVNPDVPRSVRIPTSPRLGPV